VNIRRLKYVFGTEVLEVCFILHQFILKLSILGESDEVLYSQSVQVKRERFVIHGECALSYLLVMHNKYSLVTATSAVLRVR
jgi:hypothetical protein